MPAAPPPVTPGAAQQLAELGAALAAARKRQKVSASAVAEAAGMSRVTLHRIEKGEPSVSAASWAAAAEALGLRIGLLGESPTAGYVLPQRIRLNDHPQLKKLAWQLQGVDELAPQEALQLYERNWRHVDKAALTLGELALIRALASRFGAGDLLV